MRPVMRPAKTSRVCPREMMPVISARSLNTPTRPARQRYSATTPPSRPMRTTAPQSRQVFSIMFTLSQSLRWLGFLHSDALAEEARGAEDQHQHQHGEGDHVLELIRRGHVQPVQE